VAQRVAQREGRELAPVWAAFTAFCVFSARDGGGACIGVGGENVHLVDARTADRIHSASDFYLDASGRRALEAATVQSEALFARSLRQSSAELLEKHADALKHFLFASTITESTTSSPPSVSDTPPPSQTLTSHQRFIYSMNKLRKLKRVSVFGVVHAKTEVFLLQNVSFFIVQLVCGDTAFGNLSAVGNRQVSAQIMFEQRSPPPESHSRNDIRILHQCICVSKPFLFLNLQAKQIKFPTLGPDPSDSISNIKRVLSFNVVESDAHLLDIESVTAFCRKHCNFRLELKSDSPARWLPQSTNERVTPNFLLNYTGTVTEVLDAEVGKFKLDGKHDLYITYCPVPLQIERFLHIPGINVRLHNVHTVVLETCELASEAPNRAILMACLQTNIEILKMPEVRPLLVPEVPSAAFRRKLR
ncbi:hypothetical protein BC830DRAFT_242445, partial [Chytriomyces sp. MP71]